MFLVTGATGNVGACVARQLADLGLPTRALTRNKDSAGLPGAVEIVQGDLSNPESLAGVFDGIEAVFLFTPPSGPGQVARIARAAGVKRAVLLSSIATQKADPRTNAIAARHCAAEQAVIDSGLSWTFLRPDSFASNALAWAGSIRAEGVVRAAYGQSQRCPIHEADVAAVAVAALCERVPPNSAHWLTGPESITQIAQVGAIAAAIGKPIRFEDISREDALRAMTQTMPANVATRLLDYAEKSVTHPPTTTDTVERLLKRPATPFAQWAMDHADAFR